MAAAMALARAAAAAAAAWAQVEQYDQLVEPSPADDPTVELGPDVAGLAPQKVSPHAQSAAYLRPAMDVQSIQSIPAWSDAYVTETTLRQMTNQIFHASPHHPRSIHAWSH
jgi:hypothetical protein